MTTPKIVDNDRDEITAVLNGEEIRGWSYGSEMERRQKMLMAREFAEGWYQASQHEREHFLRIVDAEKADWRGSFGSLERIKSAIVDPSAGQMMSVCEELRCDDEAAQ